MNGGDVLLAIPARGGSKRLARKNLAPIDGVPMLAHTIRAAFESKLGDAVFVCTEDPEIAAVAHEHGANVFDVEPAMAGDTVSSTVPCLALLEVLAARGRPFEYLFNLQPTSPLRDGRDVRGALTVLHETGVNFVVSVTPIDPHYFHWAVVEQEEGWGMFFGSTFLRDRSELPPVFRPNGAIKLARCAQLRHTGHFFGRPLAVYEMPEERSIHVATAFDLTCARAAAARCGADVTAPRQRG